MIFDAWTIKAFKYIILTNPDCPTISLEMSTIDHYPTMYTVQTEWHCDGYCSSQTFQGCAYKWEWKGKSIISPTLCVGLDAINIILHLKSVRATCKGPPYFKN